MFFFRVLHLVFVALGKTKWVCNGSVVYIEKYILKARASVWCLCSCKKFSLPTTFLHRTPIHFDPLHILSLFLLFGFLKSTPSKDHQTFEPSFFNVTMHPSHVLSRLSSTLINCQATYSQEAYEVKTKKISLSLQLHAENTDCKGSKASGDAFLL